MHMTRTHLRQFLLVSFTSVPLEDETDPLCESQEWDRLKDLLEDPLWCLALNLCGFVVFISADAAKLS